MKHLTLGIHYPKEGYSKDILAVAEKVCDTAERCEGLIEAGAWYDEENKRIIMLSLWENSEVALQASKKLRPIIAEASFSKWERKPSDNMIELKKMV
jgi:heme-degrading monooxygenase HmoA